MGITLEGLKNLLDSLNIRYCSNENQKHLILLYHCDGKTVHVMCHLDLEGRFFHIVSKDFNPITRDAERAAVLYEEILALNYECRFVKIGRDPSDGEVCAYGDCWIEDGELTSAQLDRMLDNFVSATLMAIDRLEKTAATGKTDRDRAFDDFMKSCIDQNQDDVDVDKPETA